MSAGLPETDSGYPSCRCRGAGSVRRGAPLKLDNESPNCCCRWAPRMTRERWTLPAYTDCRRYCRVRVRAALEALPKLEFLLLLHSRLATTAMLFMAAVGVWGLISYVRGGSLSGSYSGSLVIGQILVTIQVAAGALLVVLGLTHANPVHYLYGITAVLALPFAWSYLRYRDPRRALLIYSLLALFLFGLAVRGILTAR